MPIGNSIQLQLMQTRGLKIIPEIFLMETGVNILNAATII
jgi:hypothetical protein